jgi:hypothetical protein
VNKRSLMASLYLNIPVQNLKIFIVLSRQPEGFLSYLNSSLFVIGGSMRIIIHTNTVATNI